MGNLFNSKDKVPQKGSELFELLHHSSNIKIEKIFSNELVNGKWYEQDNDEWVVLLEGSAVLQYEEKIMELKKGDYLFIPRLTKHRISRTSDNALWLAVHIG